MTQPSSRFFWDLVNKKVSRLVAQQTNSRVVSSFKTSSIATYEEGAELVVGIDVRLPTGVDATVASLGPAFSRRE